jgi:NhaP-type Na+/H+ or K+/H+ antiporter
VLWGALAGRLERWNISGPIAFVAAGAAAAAVGAPEDVLSLDTEGLLTLTEITLAIVLFSDAAGVPWRRLEHDAILPGRLLFIGLPLTIAAGTLGAHLLLPGLSWWVCAVIGAAVAPTDAALGAAIVDDERVPRRIRRALNVESGLNDGIATPFVSFFLVAAVAGTAYEIESDAAALVALAGGAVAGIGIGWLSAKLAAAAIRRRWADADLAPVGTAAVAVLAYAAADTASLNGFVAAFVAGLTFGAVLPREHVKPLMEFAHDAGAGLALFVWLLFGVLIGSPLADMTWRELAFALLALTALRMVPVALALVGTGLDRATVAVMGWFGPRGLASVVFALLALETLAPDDADRALTAIGATVLASVVLHGVTAAPIAARFGATHPEAEPVSDP